MTDTMSITNSVIAEDLPHYAMETPQIETDIQKHGEAVVRQHVAGQDEVSDSIAPSQERSSHATIIDVQITHPGGPKYPLQVRSGSSPASSHPGGSQYPLEAFSTPLLPAPKPLENASTTSLYIHPGGPLYPLEAFSTSPVQSAPKPLETASTISLHIHPGGPLYPLEAFQSPIVPKTIPRGTPIPVEAPSGSSVQDCHPGGSGYPLEAFRDKSEEKTVEAQGTHNSAFSEDMLAREPLWQASKERFDSLSPTRHLNGGVSHVPTDSLVSVSLTEEDTGSDDDSDAETVATTDDATIVEATAVRAKRITSIELLQRLSTQGLSDEPKPYEREALQAAEAATVSLDDELNRGRARQDSVASEFNVDWEELEKEEEQEQGAHNEGSDDVSLFSRRI